MSGLKRLDSVSHSNKPFGHLGFPLAWDLSAAFCSRKRNRGACDRCRWS